MLPLPQAGPSLDPRFQQMLDNTKLRTHQYAKSQLKWIQKQFLPAVREAKALGGDVEVFIVSGDKNGEDCAKGVLRGQSRT